MRFDSGAQQQSSSMLMMLVMLMVLVLFLFNPVLVSIVGAAIGFALNPLIGFEGKYPIVTLLFASIISTVISTVIRHKFMNWTEMAKNQKTMSAFNKEYRDAVMSRNTAKMNKLNEFRPEIMKKSMGASTGQFKPMLIIMVIMILFFAWLSTFIYAAVPVISFSVPWAMDVPFRGSILLPYWILLYMFLSIPLGMFFQRSLKYYSFKKKLDQMRAEGVLRDEPKTTPEVLDEKGKKTRRRGRSEEIDIRDFVCTICGKKIKRRTYVRCRCGKIYHFNCASNNERCPTCGKRLEELKDDHND